MRTKKIAYALTLTALALTVSFCGGNPAGPDQPGPPATPTIDVNPKSVTVSVSVQVTGQGFASGRVLLYDMFDGRIVTELNFGTTPSTPGAFTTNMTPSNFFGEHTMWAIDGGSGTKSNEVKFTVLRAP